MRNNGWRTITLDERIQAVKEYERIKDELSARDKKVLKLFLYDNLSASAIARINDPDIVCIGNRKFGSPLSPGSILEIIYKYFPNLKKPRMDRADDKRVELIRTRGKQKSPHIKVCAFCGSSEQLEEHHMIPLMMGGTNDNRNLIFLCRECHREVTDYQMGFTETEKSGIRPAFSFKAVSR